MSMAKTTMIKLGVWEVPKVSEKYFYRVATPSRSNDIWSIYRQRKQPVLNNSEDVNLYGPRWKEVETGFCTKGSAVEYILELVEKESFNPVADHLNNIDDGVDLDQEGY